MQVPVIAFTGHRPKTLFLTPVPDPYDESNPLILKIKDQLWAWISGAIHGNGTREFVVGGALGVDMWAAEAIIQAMHKYTGISLTLMLPYSSQGTGWPAATIRRQERIEQAARQVMIVTPQDPTNYSEARAALLKRSFAMVDYVKQYHGGLLAVWNGQPSGTSRTIEYAKKLGVLVRIMDVATLQK